MGSYKSWFFHSIVKRNTRRNFIEKVLKEDGSYTENQHQVAEEFIQFYTQLLGSSSPVQALDSAIIREGPLVSLEQASTLTRDITTQEIKDALFSIGDDKSPGPDGYTSCFFKKSWAIVQSDFVGAIKELFTSSWLLKQMNNMVIALIPESSHSNAVGDYRPIACCNVFYNVITKILAYRLGPILVDIIDQAQATFVEGRSMVENIHLPQELLRQYNQKSVSPRCVFKIDLRKAYDSISWEFLKGILQGLCIPTKFVNWAMECVTTPMYSIASNGSLHGFFKGGRDSEFNFHPKHGPLKITHLAFADDLMLFARGDVLSVKILVQCLNIFGTTSGLKMNILKSSLYTARIHGVELEQIQELTSMSKDTTPFRYLGIAELIGQFAKEWNVFYRPFSL
ncbi:uncharacterized protein LOC111368375 [Olea europaea var. sylvestris]|uniref:uncharacterized protein LOC111368375 n=1 Tax=Olea europaea var. sylvestris TaxID=158386 RepID=UPI000C1CDC6A|nr:uncharacterized protein LOC111368375 [Olea europaea var. sylvestris]